VTRRAFTLIEALVAGSLGVVLLGVVIQLWTSGSRVDAAAGSVAALQSAVLLEGALAADLRQIAQAPDAPDVLKVTPERLDFWLARFEGDAVRLRAVTWQRVQDGHGLFRLRRTELDRGRTDVRLLPDAPLTSVRFDLLQTTVQGQRLLRLSYGVAAERLAADLRHAAPPRDRQLLMALRPLAGPGNPAFAPSCRVLE